MSALSNLLTLQTQTCLTFLYIKKEIDYFVLTSTNLSIYTSTEPIESHWNFRGTKTGNVVLFQAAHLSCCPNRMFLGFICNVSEYCDCGRLYRGGGGETWSNEGFGLWSGGGVQPPIQKHNWMQREGGEAERGKGGTTAQWHVQCEPHQKAKTGTRRRASASQTKLFCFIILIWWAAQPQTPRLFLLF